MPFSPMLLLEPTVTYSLLPSALAMTFLVQWWLRPAGSAVTTVGVALTEVCPSV
ncbi:hypothetical protein FQZ97_490840 [compost metagenome]